MGYQTNDDAGIYRLNDELAIVTTADFITPPVDDPHIFGQIAAANALSDVYAMGGRPVTCLNLVAFPSKKLDFEVLNGIVAGAVSKITEAGAVLAGGHSIEDDEPKFGLAVTGLVHPDKYWTNSGARAGDILILTKPLGSGVLFNANLKKWVSDKAMDRCVRTLATLNKAAADTLKKFAVHAVTDVTGFALAGHALEMARGSGVCVKIEVDALPVMGEALEMYEKGMSTGTNVHNRQLVQGHLRLDAKLPPWHEEILFDPQTSGGLLAAVPGPQGPAVLQDLKDAGVSGACLIGTVEPLADGVHLVFK